jgi:hypothetical protein
MELAPLGIRVNAVAPGSIIFPGGGWERRTREDVRTGSPSSSRPTFRSGAAGPGVGRVVAFLASDAASLVLGACLNVDGGSARSSGSQTTGSGLNFSYPVLCPGRGGKLRGQSQALSSSTPRGGPATRPEIKVKA